MEHRRASDIKLAAKRLQVRQAREVLDTAANLAMSTHIEERTTALTHITRALFPYLDAAKELTR